MVQVIDGHTLPSSPTVVQKAVEGEVPKLVGRYREERDVRDRQAAE